MESCIMIVTISIDTLKSRVFQYSCEGVLEIRDPCDIELDVEILRLSAIIGDGYLQRIQNFPEIICDRWRTVRVPAERVDYTNLHELVKLVKQISEGRRKAWQHPVDPTSPGSPDIVNISSYAGEKLDGNMSHTNDARYPGFPATRGHVARLSGKSIWLHVSIRDLRF